MSYCVLFCVLYRKESANKRYRNTVNNPISPNTVSQNDEKPHTAELDDTAIPHVKLKLPKYRLKKSRIPQYRKPPCPPLLSHARIFGRHYSLPVSLKTSTRATHHVASVDRWKNRRVAILLHEVQTIHCNHFRM